MASTTVLEPAYALFDMDGTLLDSTPAVIATWHVFAGQYDFKVEDALAHAHGIRTQDNMRTFCGITDDTEIAKESARFEATITEQAKQLAAEGKTGLVILPGVHDLLTVLNSSPNPCWAVVTSATNDYASQALPTAGIPAHPHLITADHVQKGKPHPEPYLAGAAQLGVDPKDCVVFEDAPAGIRSGVAAGCKVLAVCTSHRREELEGLGADWVVDDLSQVTATITPDSKVQLTIRQ